MIAILTLLGLLGGLTVDLDRVEATEEGDVCVYVVCRSPCDDWHVVDVGPEWSTF